MVLKGSTEQITVGEKILRRYEKLVPLVSDFTNYLNNSCLLEELPIKSLLRDGNYLKYLISEFRCLSEATADTQFIKTMMDPPREECNAF